MLRREENRGSALAVANGTHERGERARCRGEGWTLAFAPAAAMGISRIQAGYHTNAGRRCMWNRSRRRERGEAGDCSKDREEERKSACPLRLNASGGITMEKGGKRGVGLVERGSAPSTALGRNADGTSTHAYGLRSREDQIALHTCVHYYISQCI